jgi:hypothetical protein
VPHPDTETEWEYLFRRFPPQYGKDVPSRPGGNFGMSSDRLAWWKGDPWSIYPIRVYLKPWQPPNNMPRPVFNGPHYAQPTLWAPGDPLSAPLYFDGWVPSRIYARVRFGTGGVSHQAFVDYPPRGLLFQVSGNQVEIDTVGLFISLGPPDPTTFPILAATLGIEPGGGDAESPGTFTYDRQPELVGEPYVDFQVPPFARSVTPVIDAPTLLAAGATSLRVTQQSGPGVPPGLAIAQVIDFPLATWEGQTVTLAGQAVGVVHMEVIGGGPPAADQIGAIFQLDL